MANVVKLHCYIAGKRNTNRAIELLLMIELVNVVSEAVWYTRDALDADRVSEATPAPRRKRKRALGSQAPRARLTSGDIGYGAGSWVSTLYSAEDSAHVPCGL